MGVGVGMQWSPPGPLPPWSNAMRTTYHGKCATPTYLPTVAECRCIYLPPAFATRYCWSFPRSPGIPSGGGVHAAHPPPEVFSWLVYGPPSSSDVT